MRRLQTTVSKAVTLALLTAAVAVALLATAGQTSTAAGAGRGPESHAATKAVGPPAVGSPDRSALARARARCPYLNLCVFSEVNFKGSMHPMKSCTLHRAHFLPASWVNNQTSGTRARFLDFQRHLKYTTPGAYSLDSDSFAIGLYTEYFRPC